MGLIGEIGESTKKLENFQMLQLKSLSYAKHLFAKEK